MFNYWLDVLEALHPEGPVTGQFDQGFASLALIQDHMLNWYPGFTLHRTNAVNTLFNFFRLRLA
jgi:hypothetical protein